MQTKYGVIKSANFNEANYPRYLIGDFKDVVRCGTNYKMLFAFDEYINATFEKTFETTDEYEKWLIDFIYIIIPSELIPSLTDVSNLVADIDVQNQFNVILSKTQITTREGIELNIPSDVLNMTPCKILAWEKGDDELLQGIIDVWNSQEDYRIIEFQCKFDSLSELENFKSLQL